MTEPDLREQIRRSFEEAAEERRRARLEDQKKWQARQRELERERRKASARDARGACLAVLVVFGLAAGAVWWVVDGISDWLDAPVRDRPAATASHSPRPAPVWKLESAGDSSVMKDALLWTDMHDAEDLRLLRDVSADDIHSIKRDDLDDDKGLTSADVEITIVGDPEHGTLELQADRSLAVYTPHPGFSGIDTFDYTIKLHGQPEVQKITYRIDVGLSPGAQYRLEFKYENCAAARAAGAAPLRRGEDGYGRHLDRDNDGIACE
ncbi:excalibur calcium-binding domain-containing protein (plasmid) [Streptomyces goshikiensis]|uniref:excalibur calcium-binding domain-containing protein n=1 Tax=Streptomyces goshikiensis TaxID=1942 RepID=UPI002F90A801|nr:excalibur calcium-binding domain-containing protein [Streptomyces goshikiensis]